MSGKSPQLRSPFQASSQRLSLDELYLRAMSAPSEDGALHDLNTLQPIASRFRERRWSSWSFVAWV